MKKIYGVLIAAAILIAGFIFINERKQESTNMPEEIRLIHDYVNSINDNNWDDFVNLYVPSARSVYTDFLKDEENIENHNGILAVKKIKLMDCVELDWETAAKRTPVGELYSSEEENDSMKAYGLKTKCETYAESSFFKNGVNYFILVVINEDGEWYIGELIGSDGSFGGIKSES